MLLVTWPRLSQRPVLIVPTATDCASLFPQQQSLDYGPIFRSTHLLAWTILSSATSSLISTDFSSSSYLSVCVFLCLRLSACLTVSVSVYFRRLFCHYCHQWHEIQHRPAKFHSNQTSQGGVVMLYLFSRWRPRCLKSTSGFPFGDVTHLRRSKSMSRQNFGKIFQSNPAPENKWPPYWNSTSVEFNLSLLRLHVWPSAKPVPAVHAW